MRFLRFSLVVLSAAVCALLAAAPQSAFAQVTLSHTFVNTDLSGPNRLFRDGTASVAGTQKAFPGIVAEQSLFFTTSFLVNTGETITTTTLSESTDGATFLSLYQGAFDPADLSAGYRADAGVSGTGAGFSFTNTSLSGLFTVVYNTAVTPPAGISGSFRVTGGTLVSGAAAPEPGSLTLVGMGVLPLAGMVMRRRRSNTPVA